MSTAASTRSIALVVPVFDRGGLEQVVLNLYRAYRDAGHSCIVLVESNECDYMASFLDSREDVFIFNGDERLFLSKCLERRISICHYHYSTFGLSLVSDLGIYCIYTLHSIYTWMNGERFRVVAEQIRKADRVVAVSSFARDYFCVRAGVEPSAVQVIPNGVDIESLQTSQKILQRSNLGVPAGIFVFAHIASFFRNKHQAVMIAAAERLAGRGADFRLLLVGNVGDEVYFDELKNLVSTSSANQLIHIVDFVPRDRMASFYDGVVDAVVLPSLQEGYSNVVLEGLAFGKPMILTDVGSAREAAELSDRVHVVPPAYPDVLALDNAMIDALSRTGETPNLEPIVEAMSQVLDRQGSREWVEPGPGIRAAVSVDRMASSYVALLPDGEGLLDWPRDETAP